jgi:ribose transport system ATP-binding protein
MAKWLSTEPSLLLLHEPTHGVDVGSREQILLRIRSAARNGMAVVCASSDPEQLAELCDRVLTFERGKVVAELTGLDLNKDTIVESSYRSAISASSLDARNGGTE